MFIQPTGIRARSCSTLIPLFLTLGLTVPVYPQPAGGGELPLRRVLPGLVNSSGANGTRLESSVWLVNLGSRPAEVEFGFVPVQGGPTPSNQTKIVAAGETVRFQNVLRELFSVDETAGALTAVSREPFDLRAVTSNAANPSARYGFGIPSFGSMELLGEGESAHSIWLSHGVELSRGVRNEVSVVFTAPGAVTISVYDAGGVLRGLRVVTSDTPVTWRMPVADLVPDPELPLGRVKFAVTAGEAAAFISRIDEATGAGFIVPSERAPTGSSDLLLSGLLRTPARVGNMSLRLFNPGEEPLEVTVEAAGPSPASQAITRTVPPNGLIEIPDLFGPGAFDSSAGAPGAVRVRAASPVLAAGRINGSPTGFLRAVRFDNGFLTPTQPGTLIGLDPEAGGSIGLFAGNTGAAGLMRLRNRQGVEIRGIPVNLQASESVQGPLPDWFPGTEIPGDARVDIEVASGSLLALAGVLPDPAGDSVAVASIPLVAAPAASKLAFLAVPASVASGAPFAVTVQALRADNTLDPNFTGMIQLTASGPGSLQGTATRTAAAGVAMFEGLSLSAAGAYTLMASSQGLTAAVSNSIAAAAPPSPVIRVGTFAGQNGYTAAGDLRIIREANGSETLRLEPNFRVSSGAGTITVWLARSAGPLNAGSSVRVGSMTTRFTGEFTFPIPAAGSSGFTHVIVYCDAFRVNFGAAQLREP